MSFPPDRAALESQILAAVAAGSRPWVYEAAAEPVARMIGHLITDRTLTPTERHVHRLADGGRRDLSVPAGVTTAFWKLFDPTPKQLWFTWGAVRHCFAAFLDLIRRSAVLRGAAVPERVDLPDRRQVVAPPAPVLASVQSLTAAAAAPPAGLALCSSEASPT